jgi:hypothetical protein
MKAQKSESGLGAPFQHKLSGRAQNLSTASNPSINLFFQNIQ